MHEPFVNTSRRRIASCSTVLVRGGCDCGGTPLELAGETPTLLETLNSKLKTRNLKLPCHENLNSRYR
jgi:hypothetical protein